MMKNSIISVVLYTFSVVSPVSAKPVDRGLARAMAADVMNSLTGKTASVVDVQSYTNRQSRHQKMSLYQHPPFYQFNNADGRGFVIISGDDAFPPVVAYSLTSTLSNGAECPPAFTRFMDAYTAYVDEVRTGKAVVPVSKEKGDITGEVVTGPFLTCQWGQNSPYNYYCPNQWPVGCVATAMSQIMYFWKYPSEGKGEIIHNVAGENVTVNFGESRYDWSIMKDKFGATEWKKESGKNVAKLCYDCGIACYMDYNESGSGATIVDAYNAMFTNFGYNAETMNLYLRNAMESGQTWEDILFAELDEGRPVLYAGVSASGGGSDASGHAFVIDGYDTNRFVHVNWGWDGDNDGYYDLTLLNPAAYTFSDKQEMVTGIIPDPEGTHSQRKQFRMLMTDTLAQMKATNPKLGSNFMLKIGGIYNHAPYAGTYTVGAMFYDRTGHFVQEATVASDDLTFSLSSSYGKNPFGTVKCMLPVTIPDGYYYFSVECREKGFEQFVKPYTYGGDSANQLWVEVKEGVIRFGQTPPSLIGDVNEDGEVNISDVVAVINVMAGTASYLHADVNADNDVNISDVVNVINIMAGQ